MKHTDKPRTYLYPNTTPRHETVVLQHRNAATGHKLVPFQMYNSATGMMDLWAFTPSGVVVVQRNYGAVNE